MKRTTITLALLGALTGCRSTGTIPAPAEPATPAAPTGPAAPAETAPPATPSFSDALEPAALLRAMSAAADWQLANPSQWKPDLWHPAAFWAGMSVFAGLADDPKYFEAIRKNSEGNGWKPAARTFHADDQAISQSYLALYMVERDRRMIAPTLARLDEHLKNAWSEPLEWKDKINEREWAWCDSLFMEPPTLAMATTATGDPRYLELMNKLWWKTTDYLFDKEEKLYFRDSRFFSQKEKNGKKIFWSRGNGWVIAGLVRVLQNMPDDHAARPRFVQLYKDMAAKILTLQGSDGYWRASLLDPGSMPNPETSGTAFFTYAFAWGVNQGLLDAATYEPAIKRGWSALIRSLHANGKLGWVQRVGSSPDQTSYDGTEIYGPGALLLAGSELYRMSLLAGAPHVDRVLENPLGEARFDEVVGLPLTPEEAHAVAVGKSQAVAVDARSGAFLPRQFTAVGDGAPAELVLVSLLPKERRAVRVYLLPADAHTPPVRPRAFGRFVPERKDDFTWENDRFAFRVYGPALAATGEISSGIDLWAKRVRYPIIDAWYKGNDYHKDHGEGLDFYKVGPSRGCGGFGLWQGGKLATSGNFSTWKRLEAGPLRVTFELAYGTWGPDRAKVTESRHVSLDAGSNLSRFEVKLISDSAKLPVAVGVQRLDPKVPAHVDVKGKSKAGWASTWETHESYGEIGCGVVLPGVKPTVVDAGGHTLLVAPRPANKPFVYFAGGGWSKGLDFATAEQWNAYLESFVRRQGAPIGVSLQTENRPRARTGKAGTKE
jgi:unsaturated rhamnogalacturonyl hydrolase